MSLLRSFSAAIESLTLTGGSVEDMLLAVQATDLDWNVVLRMWRRITQARRLLRLPRARSVTFQEQFRFTKAEFLVILSNMQDQNRADLADEAGLPVMMRGLLETSNQRRWRAVSFCN
jgi:putative heme degradation protein